MTGKALWQGPIRRSFDQEPATRQAFLESIRLMEVHSEGGIYLGPLFVAAPDLDRLGKVLRKIVRGLFYDETGNVMPEDVQWSFEQVTKKGQVPEVTRDLIGAMPLRTVGTEVRYKIGLAPEDPRLTLTWLGFYNSTMFLVHTLPEGATPYDAED